MNKILLLFLIILIIVGGTYFLSINYLDKTTDGSNLTVPSTCIDEKRSELMEGYGVQPQTIIVGFKGNISLNEASALLRQYQLTSEPFISFKYHQFLVYTPKGLEAELACLLESRQEIEYVEFVHNEEAT